MSKNLFTPGPLNTTESVKRAMLVDVGSRDAGFIRTVASIRSKLLQIAGCNSEDYAVVPLQGAGTFAVEAVFATVLGKNQNSKALIISNGAYGDRMVKICDQAKYLHDVIRLPETQILNGVSAEEELKKVGQKYSLVSMVHCETSTGMLNEVNEVVEVMRKSTGALILVDAMSSFGAVPINMCGLGIDFLVSSANKCLQGVPGFAFVIASKRALLSFTGNCPSLSLDLVAQWRYLESDGQFRFTPPTHSMLAFEQALKEFEREGGVGGRMERYRENNRVIREGMSALGFKEFLDPRHNGYVITTFLFPDDEKFHFSTLYQKLSDGGQVIYPGKLTKTPTLRIGNIGNLQPEQCRKLLDEIKKVLGEMGVSIPTKKPKNDYLTK